MAFRDADDTFFVESDEPHLAGLDSRTAARIILQNRQDMIASDLSRLAGDEYLEDIILHMKEMEARYPLPLPGSFHSCFTFIKANMQTG
ncbi:hypothetical protein E4U19_003248 [Claviceps sp. Clav32 group G5]|nr:hypothetical protein E4U19_003248 [Claviceps sp. Clav32 group G5]KAG6047076.1 hypothetical protein E4U39_000758 [Claviceps sp. Clav50 group G5]